jgi:anti-sigma regulatory factor (Ser/Thr protein kinase)
LNSTKTTDIPIPPPAVVVQGDSPDAIHRTRDAVRAFTDSLTPAPDPTTADTLVLVVSELVTNALRHGGGRYTLVLSAGPDTVTVSVSDPNPAPPRERTPDLNDDSGGFGWHMVRHLTSQLSITADRPGKTIHARLTR